MSVLHSPPPTQAQRATPPHPPPALPYPTHPGDLPPELAARAGERRFVPWRWAYRDGRWTKPPVNPRTGGGAKVDDPATWGTLAEAVACARAEGLPGIGLVLTPDLGLVGLDLDHCRDAATDELAPWAAEVVRRFTTYTQVSPSGTGLRLFLRGTLPGNRQGRRSGPAEVYNGGRFLTLTTVRVPGTPDRVEERQAEVEAWYAEVFPPPAAPPAQAVGPLGVDDAEVVRRCESARNGAKFRRLFWNGDLSDYPNGAGGYDHSGADLGLCDLLRYQSGDRAQVQRLFDRSALGQRDKWRNRPDYRTSTLDKAMAGEVSTPIRHPSVPATERQNGHGAGTPAPPGPPGTPPTAESAGVTQAPGAFKPTDYGNAERLVARHGADLRHCHPWSRWLVWDGRRWAVDATAEVERRAKATVRAIYREAAAQADAGDDGGAKELARHAMRSEAKARLDAAVALAASEPGVPVVPEQLDADPWLLNVANGTLDLRTGALRPHARADYLTKQAPVRYDPDARCPTWDAFLERVLPDPDVRRFFQRAAGYSLSGSTRERILLLLWGTGRNGKSTGLETIGALLGDYAMRAPAETLLAKHDGGIPNDIARLKGARFVSTRETDEGRRLAEAAVKEMTGDETMTARFLRAEWFDFRPEFKLWLATNHKPVVRGTDKAIWDRIKLVPFGVRFWVPPEDGPPELRADTTLPARLLEELPGILAWAVRGCLDWQREGLGEPTAVTEATAAYRAEMDVLADFIDECCVVDAQASVTAKQLYGDYRQWCDGAGEKPLTQTMFGRRLGERGFDKAQLGKDRAHTWIGLGLRAAAGEGQGG